MPDETKPDQLPTTEDKASALLDIFTDLISMLTLPAHVIRNASKAFGRLCSAVIGVPAGALERRSAEKQAESEARIQIIEENAAQITRQMNVPTEYAQRAGNKFAEKIIREQINLDKISIIAANELKKEEFDSSADQNADHGEERAINDDWLNDFEEEARQKSTEEMQLRFGRILAGEIRKPGSYSIRAVKILGELDQKAARLFKNLCSMCVVLGDPIHGFVIDARVCSLGGDANANALRRYGLGFQDLNILNEYGLTTSEYHSSHGYDLSIRNENTQYCFPFWYQGRYWGLRPLPGWEEENRHKFRLWGVNLSQAGRELLRVVEQEPMDSLTDDISKRHAEALQKFFAEHNLEMVEVQVRQEFFGEHNEHKVINFYVP